jgi:hypothetical protein
MAIPESHHTRSLQDTLQLATARLALATMIAVPLLAISIESYHLVSCFNERGWYYKLATWHAVRALDLEHEKVTDEELASLAETQRDAATWIKRARQSEREASNEAKKAALAKKLASEYQWQWLPNWKLGQRP